VRTNLLGENGP